MADPGALTLDAVPAVIGEPLPAMPSPTSRRGSRAVLAAAALIVLAGAAIRFAALSTSIWFDESVSVRDISGSFGQMLHRVVNHEASPPFYFVCLWIWRHLVGSTAVELRALSALAGTMTIALAFYVARRRIGQRAALVLAVCVAVSPILVYHSTEMRMYGLLVLITGVGFEAFLRASESPNARNLSTWALASLLAVWTQYYAALAVAPEAVLLLAVAWKSHPRARAPFLAVGGVAVGGLPLLSLMPYQAQHAYAYGTLLLSSPWQRFLLSIHSVSTLPNIGQELTVGPGGPARAALGLVVLLIGILAFGLLLRHPRATKRELTRGLCLIGPTVLAVEALVLLHISVQGRYLLPLWLPVGLAASYAFTAASAGWLGLGLVGLLVLTWVGVAVVNLSGPKFDHRDDSLGAARSLGVAATDRLVAVSHPWDVLTFEEYRPRMSADPHATVRVRELDVAVMFDEGEPPPSARRPPTSFGTRGLPPGLVLTQVTRGSRFLVERFVAAMPVWVRVAGPGNAFAARNWRFLLEPAGGRMGDL